MYRYECKAYVCQHGLIPVYWSESYVNARTNKPNIKEREEEMTRIHAALQIAEPHNHIVKRVKVK